MAGRARPVGLVLLALGPVLVAAYAGAGYLAVRRGVRAQVSDPGWPGGMIDASGMTTLGVDSWRLTWWTALFVGVVALAYAVMGMLLRRGRGRTPLLVISGVLILPYSLGFLIALINPVRGLAALSDSPEFLSGLPPWQSALAYLLLAAGLVQAVGMSIATAQGKRRKPPEAAGQDTDARPSQSTDTRPPESADARPSENAGQDAAAGP
ncbi:hypothetical protein [Nonomuraea insulae]|uniref:Uncharacterized protein n=1 Tax=Nonomuraea insulae TaxID=1616787 RepID=A0ABW1D1B3_9ACTN